MLLYDLNQTELAVFTEYNLHKFLEAQSQLRDAMDRSQEALR